MGFPLAKGSSTTFKPVSAGLHMAVCVALVDFGVQQGSDRYPKPKHKVHIRWACLDEVVEWEKDGQKHTGPAIVGRTFTYSLSENSNLRPLLECWRTRAFTEAELEGFDLTTILGKYCQIQVTHETKGDKTYANVSTIVSWPKGVAQQADNLPPLVVYSPSDHNPVVFEALPQWMRDTIASRIANTLDELKQSDDEREPAGSTSGGPDFDDDIPF